MAYEDFLKVIQKSVTVQYPRLTETYRFNTAAKKSEPCPPTANGASWSIAWTLDKDAATKLYGQLRDHYNARRAVKPSMPEFSKVFGMSKNDDGTVTFKAKRNGTTSEGKPNKAPIVIDNMKRPLTGDEANIWSGSICTIRANAVPTNDPDGNGGITLLFDAVQVLTPVYGGSGMDDFDEEPSAGAPAGNDDPFGDFGGNPSPAPAQSTGVDDEIPF